MFRETAVRVARRAICSGSANPDYSDLNPLSDATFVLKLHPIRLLSTAVIESHLASGACPRCFRRRRGLTIPNTLSIRALLFRI